MKYEIKKTSPSQIEVEFWVPTEEWAPYIEKSQTLAEAAQSLMKDKYLEFLGKGEIEPLAPAQSQATKMVPGSPAEFKVLVAVLPEIELPEDIYQELSEVERKPVKIEEKELNEELESFRKTQAELAPLERGAAEGDLVTFQFSSSQLPSSSPRRDSFILGQGKLIPGFEKELIGLKAGEKKEFTLTYPEKGVLENLRQQAVNFKVEMEKVQAVNLPALDDRLAKRVGQEDLEALKERMKKGLEAQKERRAEEEFRHRLLEKIGQKVKVEVPAVLKEAEENRLLSNLKAGVQQELKIPFEQYLKETGKKEEEILKSFSPLAEENVRQFLLLRTVGQKEKIEVSSEEIEKEFQKLLSSLDEEKKKTVDQESLKRYIKSSLFAEKVFHKLEEFWRKK
jgi:trigger factor